MENKKKSRGLRIAIGGALILAVAIVAAFGLSRSNTSKTPSSSDATSARTIDYSITPLRVAPNPDGQISVEAEVLRKGSSNWTEISVDDISVTGKAQATATLVSPLPTDPIPERFILKFLCDARAEEGMHLRFKLTVKASKHFGLSSGGSQRTTHIPLVPVESASVSETQGSSHIQADSKETKPNGTIVYSGHVRIANRDGDVIQADEATVDPKDGRISVIGGTVHISPSKTD